MYESYRVHSWIHTSASPVQIRFKRENTILLRVIIRLGGNRDYHSIQRRRSSEKM